MLACSGHGTHVVDGQLVATVCGPVERINKLVTVRAVKRRYTAEVGDVVVGRVTEVVELSLVDDWRFLIPHSVAGEAFAA